MFHKKSFFKNISRKVTLKKKRKKMVYSPSHNRKKLMYKCHTNIAVLGSSAVGKTSIVKNLATSLYEKTECKPTLTEMYERSITLKSCDGKLCKHEISLLDTTGTLRTDYPRTYEQVIENCEAFILVFALNDEDSLSEIEKILRDIDLIKRCNTSPILIIANKSDIEKNTNEMKLTSRLANMNRGCCFQKSVLYNDFTDSLVSLMTKIERQKGIDRAFNGVAICSTW